MPRKPRKPRDMTNHEWDVVQKHTKNGLAIALFAEAERAWKLHRTRCNDLAQERQRSASLVEEVKRLRMITDEQDRMIAAILQATHTVHGASSDIRKLRRH